MSTMGVYRCDQVDIIAYMRGAHDMLKESAKQHRIRQDTGHAEMCEAHALRLKLAIRQVEP